LIIKQKQELGIRGRGTGIRGIGTGIRGIGIGIRGRGTGIRGIGIGIRGRGTEISKKNPLSTDKIDKRFRKQLHATCC